MVWLFGLVDQHFLEQVVRQTDNLQCLCVSQLEGGELAVGDPFLGCLLGLSFQYFEALFNHPFHAFVRAHRFEWIVAILL